MNERLNELAIQAGLRFTQLMSNPMVPVVDGKETDLEKFAQLIIEECAREVEEFARKWWSIHCHSNKHAETTRKAHDDFCALQAAIRARGKTE